MESIISWKPERLIIPLPVWALFHLTDTVSGTYISIIEANMSSLPDFKFSPHPFTQFHITHDASLFQLSTAGWGGAFVFRLCDHVLPCAICSVCKSHDPQRSSPICEVQMNCCCPLAYVNQVDLRQSLSSLFGPG